MKGVERSKRERESGQPLTGGFVMPPLNGKTCVHTYLEVLEKLLTDSGGLGGWHLLLPDFLRQRRKEFHFDEVADRRAKITAQGSLSRLAQRFGTVIRHQQAGVEIHQ